MTKSFLEIANEIADYLELNVQSTVKASWEAPQFYPIIVPRDAVLAIEAILRREFDDNDGPALEREGSAMVTIEAKIDKKKFVV